MAAKNSSPVLAARRRRRQASAWFVRLIDPELTPQLQRRWQDWRSVDENWQAFKQVVEVWTALGHAPRRVPPPVRARSVLVAGATIACLAAAALTTWALLPTSERIETVAGQWKLKRLADGTQMHAGPNSQLRVELGDTERDILVSRGDFVFEVAKDPARPFIVRTQRGSVQAVGTKFGITLLDGPLIVTVAEGKVAVSPRSNAAGSSGQGVTAIAVTAGEQISVGNGPAVPRRVDVRRELAWAEGPMVDMSGATLGEVVGEFNRRNRLQIVLADPSVAAIRLPLLVLRVDDPEFFIEYLQSNAAIEASREAPDLVRVQRGAASQSSDSR